MKRKRFRHVLWDPPDAEPPTNRSKILADDPNASRAALERRIYEEDIEDVVTERPHATRWTRPYEREGENRVNLFGRTALDRLLFLTVVPQGDDAARPISARDMEPGEADLYEEFEREQRRKR